MTYTLSECWMSCLALLSLPVFFLAPGYVASSASGLMDFHKQGWIERLLWATALSAPISLLLAVHPFYPLSTRLTGALFLLLLFAAILLVYLDAKRDGRPTRLHWDRRATVALGGAGFLVLYCLLSAVPLALGGRLYENSFWQDWNVRFQLVNAAIRNAGTPHNPMFAPDGIAAPLHYYYFWYVLCARMHDFVPVSTRAIFTASCAGAGLSLLAFLLLALKYLGPSRTRLREKGLALMLAACILGPDLLIFAVAFFRHHFFPNLQFWLEDRTPRLLHVVLWSPHHAAGLVCVGLGTILIAHTLEVTPKQRLIHTALAALCFASAAGTSTFITLLFASALLFLCVDAAARKQWPVIFSTAGVAVLALLLDASFLHQLMTAPAVVATAAPSASAPSASAPSASAPSASAQAPDLASDIPASPTEASLTQQFPTQESAADSPTTPTSTTAHPVLRPLPRYMSQSLRLIWLGLDIFGRNFLQRRVLNDGHPPPRRTKWLLSLLHRPIILAFFLLDLGFFAYVLFRQARWDFLLHRPMPRPARLLWLIFLGIGIPGTRVTSAPLQTNNDFARHAGLGMEFVLLLWSAPLIADFLAHLPAYLSAAFSPILWAQQRRTSRPEPQPVLSWPKRLALALALLGLAGQAAQILLDRVRMPLTDAGLLPRLVVAEYIPRIGFRFAQIQQGMAAAARLTGTNGIVQANPHSLLAPAFLFYTSRQMAASDDGCNTPFGGDPAHCPPLTRSLIGLFGGTGPHYLTDLAVLERPIAFRPELVTVDNLSRVCTLNKIDLVAAAYTDPVWWDKRSWVWNLQPLFANSTLRLYACPHRPGAPVS